MPVTINYLIYKLFFGNDIGDPRKIGYTLVFGRKLPVTLAVFVFIFLVNRYLGKVCFQQHVAQLW